MKLTIKSQRCLQQDGKILLDDTDISQYVTDVSLFTYNGVTTVALKMIPSQVDLELNTDQVDIKGNGWKLSRE